MHHDESVEVLRLLSIVSRRLPARRGDEEQLLLWLTSRFGGITPERLGRVMGLKPAAVARLQAKLVKRGHLGPDLHLTPAGQAASVITDEATSQLARSVLGRLPRARLAGAREVLTALSLALAGGGGL